MSSFLDCYIWSISCCNIDQYFLIEKVYYHNSLTNDFVSIVPGNVQVPEFEIKNIHLLNQVDFDIINKNQIPIIKLNDDDSWSIDLKYYYEFNSNM